MARISRVFGRRLICFSIAFAKTEKTHRNLSVRYGPCLVWLPGSDSNQQPSGYKRPSIAAGLGLSHLPRKLRESGAKTRLIGKGSSSSSLCTFLLTKNPYLPYSAGFAQDYPQAKLRTSLNSPDFPICLTAESCIWDGFYDALF